MASVKTAISVPGPLLAQAETLACELGVSRSRIFVLALEEFLRRREDQLLLEQINMALADPLDAEEEIQLQGLRQLSRRSWSGNEW